MRWMPRLRMLLARRPWIYWMVVAGVAGGVALPVATALADVRRERDSWGATKTVFVATRAIDAGSLIATSVESRKVPVAVVPDNAARELTDDAIATQRIGRGEMVVDIDVSPAPGPLALLPAGWLAITIDGPVNDTFAVGQPARVLAGGETVTPDAVVIRVLADGVVVGVPADVAAIVASVAAQRLAVVALAGK